MDKSDCRKDVAVDEMAAILGDNKEALIMDLGAGTGIVGKYVRFIIVRNEVAKVMFLHVSVILSTGGGLPECMLGYYHHHHHPQEADHPPPGSRPPPREADAPGKQNPPGSRPPWEADRSPPRERAAAADGTHPTGMQSCFPC